MNYTFGKNIEYLWQISKNHLVHNACVKIHTLARSSCQPLLFAPPPPPAAITVFHCNHAAGCSHPLAATACCRTHIALLHAVACMPHPLLAAAHTLAACHPLQPCPRPLPPTAPPMHAARCRTHAVAAAYCCTHAPCTTALVTTATSTTTGATSIDG
jgi:hypothetical protein